MYVHYSVITSIVYTLLFTCILSETSKATIYARIGFTIPITTIPEVNSILLMAGQLLSKNNSDRLSAIFNQLYS